MTKLFGEYLLEKGIVKKTELLTALVRQIKSTPTPLEVAFEKNLLDHDTLLKILLHQHYHRVSFFEALHSVGITNVSLISEIEKHITQVKEPLGEILIKMGAANLDSIADALDNFLTETKFEPESKKQEESISAKVGSNEHSLDGSQNLLHSTPLDGGSTQSTIATFLEQFSLESYLELKILFSLTSNLGSIDKFVPKAIDILQVLRGAARFVNLNHSEQIIKSMITILEKIHNNGSTTLSNDELTKIENYILDALDFLSLIREMLEEGKSEDIQKSDPAWSAKYEAICKGL